MDVQEERMIQTLEYILIVSVVDFNGSWDDHIPLIEFSYNNNYHSSIFLVPFQVFLVEDIDIRLEGLRFLSPQSLVQILYMRL